MLILRIKQGESALKDGRLDEAYDIASSADVRAHKQGQRLAGRVVERLVERARSHQKAERYKDALLDCDKAARIGGNKEEVAKLRAEAAAALGEDHRARHNRERILNAARKEVERGRLTAGKQLLENLGESAAKTNSVAEDIELRRAAAQTAVSRARAALKRDDFEAAIDALAEARVEHQSGELADITSSVVHGALKCARSEFGRGRVDRAAALVQRIKTIGVDNRDVSELADAIEQCRRAARLAKRGETAEALQALKRVAQVAGNPGWVKDAIKQAEKVVAARVELLSGPLGLAAEGHESRPAGRANVEVTETVPIPPPERTTGTQLPSRFLLQVDGAGSFLVMRKPNVSIGAVSSSRRPDVGLLAQANLPVALIERMDEDYFLRSDGGVAVNGKKVTNRLLAHGDRVTLGPRCDLKYVLPNPASTTAVLDLSGARLPRADTRKIVLLDESLIIGPGRSAHVRVEDLEKPVVLHMRDGVLKYRRGGAGRRERGKAESSIVIPVGESTEIGGATVVVTKW